MATKPLTQPPIWASNVNWSTGPHALEPNKSDVAADAIAPEGHVPGALFPSAADVQNSVQNRSTLLARWLFEGTFLPNEDAHVVETDAVGKAGVAQLNVAGHTTQSGPTLAVGDSQGATNALLVIGGTNDAAVSIKTSSAPALAMLRTAGSAVVCTINTDTDAAGLTCTSLNNTSAIFSSTTTGKSIECISWQETGGGAVFRNGTPGGEMYKILVEGKAAPGTGNNGCLMEGTNGNASTPGGWGGKFVGGDNSTAFAAGAGMIAEGGLATGAGPAGVGLTTTGADGPSAGEGIVARSNRAAANIIDAKNDAVAASGSVMLIEAANLASCITAIQTGGKQAAIVASCTATGGDVAAPMRMIPQADDIAGTGVLTGSVWMKLDGVRVRPRLRMSANSNSFSYSTGPSCFAEVRELSGITNIGVGVYFDISGAAVINFDDPDGIPAQSGDVLITLKFRIKRTTASSDVPDKGGYSIRIHDDTSTVEIKDFRPDMVSSANASADTIFTYIEQRVVYTLPNSGQRSFSVDHAKLVGAADGIEIEDLWVTIQPYRRM